LHEIAQFIARATLMELTRADDRNFRPRRFPRQAFTTSRPGAEARTEG